MKENNEVYKDAIKALFHNTFEKFEHDEHRAIELFDRLLLKHVESHCDDVREMCLDAGYDKPSSDEIANIYDIISIYHDYKYGSLGSYWDDDRIEKLINN